jgi:D-alanyl-lipoteichoic acid acyltransferase DltB (MBOAT superfamily)
VLFNSLAFLVYFPLVLLIFHLSPRSLRIWCLLVSSLVFYGYGTLWHLILIFFVIAVAYGGSRLIETRPANKKIILVLALILLLAPLGSFKYLPFVYAVTTGKEGGGFPVLPVGISFFTFQGMGYVIDVYRGLRAEKNIIPTSLFILFFPQLVAGPIERASRLIKQFKEFSKVTYYEVLSGLSLMAWGFFKKIVIADRLAMVVNEVYSHPRGYGGVYLILATVFFSFQIYCDFSGYSDIAIGAARTMGIRIMDNFNRPYSAISVSDFWRRWHISLSTWFRDYLYIPLGGNRATLKRWHFNILVTFILSGAWHGANWTFLLWGGLHGSYMLIEFWYVKGAAYLKENYPIIRAIALPRWLKVIAVFISITLAWVLFRANSVTDAWYIITHLTHGIAGLLIDFIQGDIRTVARESVIDIAREGKILGFARELFLAELTIAVLSLGVMWWGERRWSEKGIGASMMQWSESRKIAFILVMVQAIILVGVFSQSQFIYFKF